MEVELLVLDHNLLDIEAVVNNYLEHIAAVIEVDMEAYYSVDQVQVLDSVPFYTHAYEVVVVAEFDNYLELPFQLVLVWSVRSVDALVALQPDQ